MKKRWRSWISVLLTVFLLIQMLPVHAFAVTRDELTESGVIAEEEVYDSEATILGEIVSERDEYVKRFRMSDGTIQVVQYDVPVHYLDDNGQWVEYDKSLSEDAALEEVIEETENTEVSDVPEEDVTAEEPAVEMPEEPAVEKEVPTDGELPEESVEEEPAETPAEDQPASEVPEETENEEVVSAAAEVPEEELIVEEETVVEEIETGTEVPEEVVEDTETSETEVVEEEDVIETPAEEITEEEVIEVPVEEASESTEVSVKEWINLSPDFSVRFSKKTNGNKFVRVEADGHALAWAFSDANKVDGVVVQSEVSDDPRILSNVRGAVIYPGAFNNADLEYVLQPGSLKENIILQNADAVNAFTIEYKYNTLTAVQVDNQTVEFRDAAGQAVYVLYAPYMTDANGEFSDALTLEITKNKKNSCTIQLVADEDWLNDTERAFPVTVDPLLITSQAWNDESCCQSCFIASKDPNTSFGLGGTEYMGSMYAGYYSEHGSMRSLVKLSTLPALGIGDKVVYAELATYVKYSYPANTITAHRILTNWSQSTATWNSGIQYESTIRDYQIVPEISRTNTTTNRWESFNITDLVRGWYSGDYPNYGVMLRSNYESSGSDKHVQFYSSGAISSTVVRPMLLIYYRNMTGYEDYWSYTSVAAGRNGTASVNNYNGNLSFVQPLTQDAGGTLMPVNLSAVYNSTASTAPYSSMGVGFQTNYHLYVRENPNLNSSSQEAEKKYKFYLNDSDGTRHYFYFENLTDTTGKDEDGLGYEISVDSSVPETSVDGIRYTIKDRNDNKMYFNGYGNLIKIENTVQVSTTIAYDASNRISTITDGAGRTYTFAYNGTDKSATIASITDPADRVTTLSYTGTALTGMTFPDGESISLSYSSGLLSEINGIDTTSSVDVAYRTTSVSKPVASISTGSSTKALETYSFTYLQNETTVTDIQGRSYTYQFNNFGQTTGVVSNEDGQAVFLEYYPGNEPGEQRANKLRSESKVQYTTPNYVANPQFTSDVSSFNPYNTISNYTREWDGTYGRTNDGSYKFGKTDSGTVYALQYRDITAGTYTFSAYVSSKDSSLSGSAIVRVEAWNGNESCDAYYSATSTSACLGDGEWERVSVTFTVPEVRTLRLILGMEGDATGNVWFDDLQLSTGYGETTFNLVENNGYAFGNSRWSSLSGTNTVSSRTAADNFFSLNISLPGSPTAQRNVFQTIYNSGSAGDVFSFGAWVRADSAPTTASEDGSSHHDPDPAPKFQLVLNYYKDGSNIDNTVLNANSAVSSWQFISGKSIAKHDYDQLTIEFVYDYNVNTAYMTGSYVYKEQFGQTYVYDDDGNVISAVDQAESESTFQYDENNMLSKLINPSGSSYEYTYHETTKLLTSATSSDGQTYDFTYDTKGNVLTAVISAEGSSQTINSSATYTTSQNFMSSLTDQRGNTTSYTYDETRGTLLSVTDPTGALTTYVYNTSNDQLQSVSTGGLTTGYTYDNDRLTQILSPSGTTYRFTYDTFGRNTGIKIGTTTLAGYTYNSNGLLTQQTYGNGTTLNYSYDALDRLSAKWYNTDSYKTEYLYGDNGQLSMVLDSAAATRTKYIYDMADRIVGERVYNTAALNGNTLLSSTDYTFADATNYLTGIKYYANGLGTNTIGYRYGDTASGEMPDQVYGVSWNGAEVLTNTYDAFGRLTRRDIALTDSTLATDTLLYGYSYYDGADDSTTTSLVKRHWTNHTSFLHYYDANGNITRIFDGMKFTDFAYYTYDSLNQLVREDNKAAGYTYVYTYSGGNITSKTTYAYTRSETLGTALNTETWTYGNANWPDLLTGYSDGTSTYTVSSDDLGNLTYIGSSSTNNTTHTWLGRLLESTTVTSGSTVTEIDYAYNGDGQRTSKTANGVTTKYYYNGDVLVGMTIGSTPLTFLYDENGDYFGFTYSGATYYYIKNLQGDVIGITNESGTLIVQYSYDAWGKPLSVSGTAASTIGELNPIRYRGYYYDTETGYYYLNSRYYDPELCRFLSADNTGYLGVNQTVGSYNLFCYCENNPVVREDAGGTYFETALDVASLVVDVLEIAASPTNPLAWGALAADVACLILPGITGGGGIVRIVANSDNLFDIAKYADDILDTGRTMVSERKLGQAIHQTYDPIQDVIENGRKLLDDPLTEYGSRLRPDAVDTVNGIIYELKPFNRRSLKAAIRQTDQYAKVMGGKWTVVIDLYIK